MALEFILHTDCALNQKYKPKELMEFSKIRDTILRFEQNEAEVLKEGNYKRLDDVPIIRIKPDGRQIKSTVKDLRKQWSSVSETSKRICVDCPFKVLPRQLGCYSAMNYPISAKLEEWVAERFKPNPDELFVFCHIIERQGFSRKDAEFDRRPRPNAPFGLYERKEGIVLAEEGGGFPEMNTTDFFKLFFSLNQIYPDLSFAMLSTFKALTADPETLKQIGQLAMGTIEGEPDEDKPKIILFNPYTGFFYKDGIMNSVFSPELPLHLYNHKNAERLSELMQETQFLVTQSKYDDRSITDFKELLRACYINLFYQDDLIVDG